MEGLDICRPCREALPHNAAACPRCGMALESCQNPPYLCGRCQQKAPAFDATQAIFLYQGPIRHLILSLKFKADYPCARLLGSLMAQPLARLPFRPQCLIPVPLHGSRYRQRGFNQALEIARPIARELNIPIRSDCCRRTRSTPPQSELPAKKRLSNLKNAFEVRNLAGFDHVAIIDDVITTGATVNELAKALKRAGIQRIDVWTCARA